jgi:hypothetical protein
MLLTILIVVAVLLAIAVVVWQRSPWGRRRPLPRYAVLSLAAHLLLAIIAAAVRVVARPPGAGEPAPIRVTVLAELPRDAVETLTEPVPTAEAKYEPERVEPVVEELAIDDILPAVPIESEPAEATVAAPVPATTPSDVQPLAAPALAAAPPEPKAEESPAILQAAVESAAVPLEEPTEPLDQVPLANTQPAQPAVAQTEPPVQHTPQQPDPTPPSPAPTSPFADRLSPDRLAKAEQQGGSRETEEAVAQALAWLAAAQAHDGRWNAAQWGAGRETEPVLGHDRGRTGTQADTGITGLALLAFLGAGNSHQSGGYQQNMADGLNFLIRQQRHDGYLGGDALPYAQTYCHSMATFALAESLAMTGDQRLRPSVERAVGYLLHSQDLASGGWRYRPGQPGDLSQLGWVIMALRSAELGGVTVPESCWSRIEHFLQLVAVGHHGGLACYKPGDLPSRAMTAEALYCRQIMGLTAAPGEQSRTSEAASFLAQDLPGDNRVNLYHWYYASLALHHAAQQSPSVKPTWQEWNNRLQATLLPRQETSGAARGSWPPSTVWGGYGGRVYSTAMATMCLETYYRYHVSDPERDPWMAAREVPNLR